MFVIGINLKSNMDRFIGTPIQPYLKYINYLKSNMDRFIACFNFKSILCTII